MDKLMKIMDDLDSISKKKASKEEIINKWIELYLYEKRNYNDLNETLRVVSIEEFFDFFDKMESLERQNYFLIDQSPLLNNKIIKPNELKLIDYPLTNKEIEALLSSIVQDGREFLINNGHDVRNESLIGKCLDATGYIVSKYSKYFDIYELNNYNLFDTMFCHQFSVINLTTTDGNVKKYLIDITYRQFFLISKCLKERVYHIREKNIMPGYFADENFSKELMSKGYIELNEINSKLYCDSFVSTYLYKKYGKTFDINIDGKQYIKALETGINIRH